MISTDTIFTAFRKSPQALRRFGGNIGEVERMLARVRDPECKTELSKVLAHLPAEEILRYFGQDILLWTWLMYPERGMTKETLGRGIEEVTEIDIDVLERAQILKILVSREDGYEHILKNYRLLQAKEEGMWGQENLQTILLNARKKGEETRFNEEERAKYSITASGPSVRRNYGWNIEWKNKQIEGKRYQIYFDGAFGFILQYKTEPIAVCAFDTTTATTAVIKQLQGIKPELVTETKTKGEKVRGHTWALAPIDWTQFFVEYTSVWLQQFGFEEIGIQTGKYNRWVHSNGNHKLPLEIAVVRYDTTAQRLGFTQRDDENWYRRI